MKKETTIRLDIETKKLLDKRKIHPRQSFDEVLRKLMEEVNGRSKWKK